MRKVNKKIEIVFGNLKSPTHSLLRKLYSSLSWPEWPSLVTSCLTEINERDRCYICGTLVTGGMPDNNIKIYSIFWHEGVFTLSAWAREMKSYHRTLALEPLHRKGHEGVKRTRHWFLYLLLPPTWWNVHTKCMHLVKSLLDCLYRCVLKNGKDVSPYLSQQKILMLSVTSETARGVSVFIMCFVSNVSLSKLWLL